MLEKVYVIKIYSKCVQNFQWKFKKIIRRSNPEEKVLAMGYWLETERKIYSTTTLSVITGYLSCSIGKKDGWLSKILLCLPTLNINDTTVSVFHKENKNSTHVLHSLLNWQTTILTDYSSFLTHFEMQESILTFIFYLNEALIVQEFYWLTAASLLDH